jgi:serine/threonine protein kinase/tetratricopeptide (TPR) repeat protein
VSSNASGGAWTRIVDTEAATAAGVAPSAFPGSGSPPDAVTGPGVRPEAATGIQSGDATHPNASFDPDATRLGAPTDGRARPDEPTGPLSPGQPFGPRYHIVRELGIGGMGAVYQAWDAELGVVVAVKVIRPEIAADPSAAGMLERRFKQELLLARQVTHKNVVRIHELGEIDGIKFITMPFIEGEELATVLRKKEKLPIDRILKIARGIATGLEAAHAAGVVHRDLKPANIMVDKGDEALIMDFGVARSTGGTNPGALSIGPAPAWASGHTMVGAVVGTVEYMAPEQARAQPVDQRADIYAFGLILYDLLLNRQRVHGAGTALNELTSRMQSSPPALRTVDSSIPEPLERLVMRCIEPDAGQRFQTTPDLVAALNRLDDRGQLRPVARNVTRRLVASVLGLFVSLLGLTWWLARTPPTPAERQAMSILVADFENTTGDAVFDGALEQALSLGIEGAAFIRAYPRADALRVARVLERGRLNEESARLVATREGINVVLAGSIAIDSSGYALTVRALNPAPDAAEPLAVARTRARAKADVLGAIGSLASTIRSELGDSEPAEEMAGDTVSASSVEAVKAYSEAQELQASGSKSEALAAYRRAIDLDQKFGLAYSGAAITAFELGREQEAQGHWQMALKLQERMTERERLRVIGAFAMLMSQNYPLAIRTFDELRTKYPADLAGQGNLALAYFWSLDMPKALEEGKRLVAMMPNDALNRSNYALYAMYAGDFDTAQAETTRVIEQQPDFSVAYVPLAIAALARGNLDEADAAYTRMRKTPEPGPSIAMLGLADAALYQGDAARAENLLREGIEADRAAGNLAGMAAKFVALAETHEALGRKAQAVQAAHEALQLGRNRPTALLAAMVLLRNDQDAAVRSLIAELSEHLQAQMRAYGKILEARLAMKAKRAAEAIAALEAALKLADMWIARYYLGVAYVEVGSFAEGLSELRNCEQRRGEATALFLDENPTFRYLAPLSYWLARAQERVGNSAQAIANYKAYLDLRGPRNPRDPLVIDAKKRIAQ